MRTLSWNPTIWFKWLSLLPPLAFPVVANAQGDFVYADNGDGGVIITAYTGTTSVVNIPTLLDGHPVTGIGGGAFAGTAVTSVTMSNNITSIGGGAFEACVNLVSILLPASLTSLGSEAFESCISLREITVPGGVDTVPFAAFRGCTSLTKVTLVQGVKSIEFDGFFLCTSLVEVIFPDTLTTIGVSAFNGCGFTNLVIPDTLTDIQDNAFANCPWLRNFTWSGSAASMKFGVFQGCSKLTEVAIPDNVTNVAQNAFSACTALTNVSIGAGLVSLEPLAFSGCGNLLTFRVSPQNSFFSDFGGVLFDKDQTRLLLVPFTLTGTYTLPQSVLSIGPNAFRNLGITNVHLPDGLLDIGAAAFYNTGLISFTIPDSVTNIGGSAFAFCPNLANVGGGKGVNVIGARAFQFCNELTNFSMGPSVMTIGADAFSRTKLSSVTIPDSATTVFARAFENCANLTNAVIGNGVTMIAGYAFSGCLNLESVTLGSGLLSIEASAFQNCQPLTTLTIPAKVTKLGPLAFFGCTNITTIYFLGNAPVADGAMSGLLNPLAVLYYTVGATGWESTFEGYPTQLWDGPSQLFLTLVNGNLTVKKYFGSGSVYNLPASINGVPITSIGPQAFAGSGLSSITIGLPVTSIGDLAFYFCTNLQTIYFAGDAPALGNGPFFLVTAVVYYPVGGAGWGPFFGGLAAVPLSRLSYTRSTGAILLSWEGDGLVVQQTTNVANPSWTDVPNANHSPYQVSTQPGQRFFRLRRL